MIITRIRLRKIKFSLRFQPFFLFPDFFRYEFHSIALNSKKCPKQKNLFTAEIKKIANNKVKLPVFGIFDCCSLFTIQRYAEFFNEIFPLLFHSLLMTVIHSQFSLKFKFITSKSNLMSIEQVQIFKKISNATILFIIAYENCNFVEEKTNKNQIKNNISWNVQVGSSSQES